MSIARILDGKLSATLALIMIIGWLVVDIVDAYPVARPDVVTAVIIIAMLVVAFKFYQEDRTSGKDPVTQKAQIDASVELYLDKLAKYSALSKGTEHDNPLTAFINWVVKQQKEPKEESVEIVSDEVREAEESW